MKNYPHRTPPESRIMKEAEAFRKFTIAIASKALK